MNFENFAKIEGLSLMLWESDVYASSDTALASRAFKAGQQSKQKEVDDLKEKLQSILNRVCMLQQSNGERIYKEIKEILNEL